ncbi:MAG: BatA domain-containing protein, partial [Beijerinckiaceae bacterium]
MTLVPLAFSAPLALIGLALLPVIYYLLRITPPRPRQIPFPPLKLILDMEPKNETPARTPWWLLALRLMIAGLIVLAMAGPIWNPQHSAASGREPLLVLLDDGWPAAPSWEQRLKVALAQVDDAARQGA